MSTETCPATPPGFPRWRCKLEPGHEGDHRRGPARWPNTEKHATDTDTRRSEA